MKKISILLFLVIALTSCSSSQLASNNGRKIKQKTPSYIYKNGFKNTEIRPILTINGIDSVYINELRFHRVSNAFYTQKVMYDTFGHWDKEVRPNNEKHTILVWEKRQLFGNKNELYSVAADGIEITTVMYASVLVFDAQNKDCFSEQSKVKDSLIRYFSNGIKNISTDRKFYTAYRNMMKKR